MLHREKFKGDINLKYLLSLKQENLIENIINECEKLKEKRNELLIKAFLFY